MFGIYNRLIKIKDSSFIRKAIYDFILKNIDSIFNSETTDTGLQRNEFCPRELLHFHKTILKMLSENKPTKIRDEIARYIKMIDLEYFKAFYKNSTSRIFSERKSPDSLKNRQIDFNDLDRNDPKTLESLLIEDMQILF